MFKVWLLPKFPWTLALSWQMGDERDLKIGWEVCMSRAGKGIFHPHPIGQTSVTTLHLPAREAGHLSSCVPGWRGKRPGKHHGVSATASSNIPNPRVLSAQGHWLCRSPEGSWGHVHWKAHLPPWSCWLSSNCYLWKHIVKVTYFSPADPEGRNSALLLSFILGDESSHCSLRTLSVGTRERTDMAPWR